MPKCICFKMCSENDIKYIFEHTPKYANEKWITYLQLVYNQPFDKKNYYALDFEILYPEFLPADMCTKYPKTARCSDCKGWLSINKTKTVDPARFFQTSLPSYKQNYRKFVGFQSNEVAYNSDDWVEVIRVYNDGSYPKVRAEGNYYGCWMWNARGSGIYINTRKTLFFNSRYIAAKYFTKMFSYSHHDITFANATRRLGYSSLQILHGSPELFNKRFRHQLRELIIVYDGCYSSQFVLGSCPSNVLLRSGWNASRPCVCNSSQPVINCI